MKSLVIISLRRSGTLLAFLLVGLSLQTVGAQLYSNVAPPLTGTELAHQFPSPPGSARPWVYWMWLRVNTNRKAITLDLEEMHAKGIEGAILYDSGGTEIEKKPFRMVLQGKDYKMVKAADFESMYATPIPTGSMPSWSPVAQEMIQFAIQEAGRIGVKLVFTVGLAGTSGPIAPEFGMQRLVWSETDVTGPQTFDALLSAPTRQAAPTLGEAPSPQKSKIFAHDIAVLAVPLTQKIDPDSVINLSSNMDREGHLRWNVPVGLWKILRFGYEPTGARNVWGLYTDAMSRKALDVTWNSTIGPILRQMQPDQRKGLIGIEDDSWEGSNGTWTPLFPSEFQHRRGYNLIPWLPVLAGIKMGSPDSAGAVKRDFYRTIADLVADNHYVYLRELSNQQGLACFSEPAGPHPRQFDLMQNCNGVDFAMGEFWYPSTHRPAPQDRFLLRTAASANHIYGKPITGCESLTSVGPFWEESFFDLKNVLDQAYCDGCNLNVIHNFSHSPSVTAKPGYVYFAGTYYNRNVTWWEQTPALNTYMARCSFLLQQGHFVADALYYRGDSIGQGEQMKPRPALPAEGYDYDDCNLDVLLTRLSVKDRQLILPDGMTYRMLVLPNSAAMPLSALKKLDELAKAGATIVGPKPSGIAGMPEQPDDPLKFRDLAVRMWPTGLSDCPIGLGHIYSTAAPAAVLTKLNLPPDFEFSGLSSAGQLDWIHRSTQDSEIYFIASRWDPPEKLMCTFRVSGKKPELWDPVTGQIRDALAFTQKNGRTTLPLEFTPRGSLFVVFRQSINPDVSGSASSNSPEMKPLMDIVGPWKVSFDPKWGGPATVEFEQLMDWTKRPEEGIRHYSGSAVYKKTFHLDSMVPAKTSIVLDLGEVHEEASVKLNGIQLGVVWTKPALLDISSALHVGDNDLEITIVNLWPNRLIGDESLQPADRLTETNMHKFSASTPLYASGLIGPVALLTKRAN